jgi:hypothetical protein
MDSKKLESLADDVSEEAYERMPIEEFGKNILSGLGWKEGEAIGGKNKGLAKPIMYLPRQKGLGLGAKPLNVDQIKGMKNLGKNMRGKKGQHEAYAGGENSKNYIGVDEELKVEEKMKVGSRVYIYKGQHKGLLGSVTKIYKPQDSGLATLQEDESKIDVVIELDINQSEVVVRKSRAILESKRKELLEKGIIVNEEEKSSDASMSDSEHQSEEEEKSERQNKKRYSLVESFNNLTFYHFSKHKPKKNKSKKSKSKHKKDKKKKNKRLSSSESSVSSGRKREKKAKHKKIKWVMQGLIVRVVSQKCHNGKLYNTKVLVQDIVDKDTISVLHENVLYENI